MILHVHPRKFSEHHVVPEVVEVQHNSQDDDNTQDKHVLRCPLHLLVPAGNGVTLVSAGPAVLCREDEGIHDVRHS